MATFSYTILAGDTLSSIASGLSAAAGVTVEEIEQANPGVAPTALSIGMALNIPAHGGGAIVLRYTVMAGDSYSKIAAELSTCSGLTYQAIEQANPGLNPNTLKVGQVITIPENGGVTPPGPVEPSGDVTGLWWWTWSSLSAAPASTNLGIAFSGWTDPGTAVQQSAAVSARLPGLKFISLGGGNGNGAFTSEALTAITAAIDAGRFAGYDGIAYDVEEGEAGLETLFAQSFAAARAKGYKVLVTVSHSAPYGISDAATLMAAFFADSNIDYLSPQLYTTGEETANDYATSAGVSWAQYATAKATVIPSIVRASLYADAKSYFQQQGVAIGGFVQWSQSA